MCACHCITVLWPVLWLFGSSGGATHDGSNTLYLYRIQCIAQTCDGPLAFHVPGMHGRQFDEFCTVYTLCVTHRDAVVGRQTQAGTRVRKHQLQLASVWKGRKVAMTEHKEAKGCTERHSTQENESERQMPCPGLAD